MKKFNKIITVEVSVDSIAEQLLSTMSPDFKHKELVVEAIIGTGVDKGTLSYVYNALNGFSPEIDFKVGDAIVTGQTEYMYKTEESRTTRNSKPAAMEDCIVVGIDLYSPTKLNVEYTYYNQDGTTKRSTTWLKHTVCNKTPQTV